MVDPISGPFVSLAVITPTLLAAQGVVPYDRALFARNGERLDIWVMLVFGYALLLVLAQIRLLPLYLRGRAIASTRSWCWRESRR
ncbi:hypothetical protein AB0J20_27450 [Micromonospora costi]|uniref:hypothetical protein n=1 Tax=Micromonospora costi TaxID=1530042 RepID=UPI0033F895C1